MSCNTAAFAPLKDVLSSDFHPKRAGRTGTQEAKLCIVLVVAGGRLPSKGPVASLEVVAEAAQPMP